MNSTLAGALVCPKMGVNQTHIEAGVRSFDRRVPGQRVPTHCADFYLVCRPRARG